MPAVICRTEIKMHSRVEYMRTKPSPLLSFLFFFRVPTFRASNLYKQRPIFALPFHRTSASDPFQLSFPSYSFHQRNHHLGGLQRLNNTTLKASKTVQFPFQSALVTVSDFVSGSVSYPALIAALWEMSRRSISSIRLPIFDALCFCT